MNDSKYEAWLNNRSIRRRLHQFSEQLPSHLREDYLALLEDVVDRQKAMEPAHPFFRAAVFRKYHAIRSSWMALIQR
jgi:hypothetical protein